MDKNTEAAKALGKKGGMTTYQRYGAQHFANISSKGKGKLKQTWAYYKDIERRWRKIYGDDPTRWPNP